MARVWSLVENFLDFSAEEMVYNHRRLSQGLCNRKLQKVLPRNVRPWF